MHLMKIWATSFGNVDEKLQILESFSSSVTNILGDRRKFKKCVTSMTLKRSPGDTI